MRVQGLGRGCVSGVSVRDASTATLRLCRSEPMPRSTHTVPQAPCRGDRRGHPQGRAARPRWSDTVVVMHGDRRGMDEGATEQGRRRRRGKGWSGGARGTNTCGASGRRMPRSVGGRRVGVVVFAGGAGDLARPRLVGRSEVDDVRHLEDGASAHACRHCSWHQPRLSAVTALTCRRKIERQPRLSADSALMAQHRAWTPYSLPHHFSCQSKLRCSCAPPGVFQGKKHAVR